jgi:hypothetical protein
MNDIFTVHEFDTIVICKIVSYSGNVKEFTLPRDLGDKIVVGGTASNEVIRLCCNVHSTFISEDNGREYAVITLKDKQYTCLTCGKVKQQEDANIIETYDLNDNMRFLVISEVPSHVRRHFINIDLFRDEKMIRRLRIDPYFGEGRII